MSERHTGPSRLLCHQLPKNPCDVVDGSPGPAATDFRHGQSVIACSWVRIQTMCICRKIAAMHDVLSRIARQLPDLPPPCTSLPVCRLLLAKEPSSRRRSRQQVLMGQASRFSDRGGFRVEDDETPMIRQSPSEPMECRLFARAAPATVAPGLCYISWRHAQFSTWGSQCGGASSSCASPAL